MDKQIASVNLQLLQRVQLSGQEVPAYNAVVAALEAILNAPDAPIDVEVPGTVN